MKHFYVSHLVSYNTVYLLSYNIAQYRRISHIIAATLGPRVGLDSEDEKKIKRAIKESKALRNEKKASSSRPRVRKPVPSQRQGPSWTNSNPRQVGLYNSATKAVDEEIVRCFRCRNPGHIAGSADQPMQGMLSQEQYLPANLCHRADGEEPVFVICLLTTLTRFPQLLLRGDCVRT